MNRFQCSFIHICVCPIRENVSPVEGGKCVKSAYECIYVLCASNKFWLCSEKSLPGRGVRCLAQEAWKKGGGVV